MRSSRHMAWVLGLTAALWSAAGSARAEPRPSVLPVSAPSPVAEMPAGVSGQPVAEPGLLLAQWSSLPPEQRQQMRQQMREHWQQMPPEQRDERRQEFRERWQQVPSEERQRIREEMRERGGSGDGRYRDRR